MNDDEKAWLDEYLGPPSTELVAQLWGKPKHAHKVIDTDLALDMVELLEDQRARTGNWIETSAQESRNTAFYRDICHQIGEILGVEAYTSDDGSIQDSVLSLKLPELVRALKERNP